MTALVAMRLAARSVKRAPLRAVLMGLGLTLGLLAITLSVASGEGARRAVEQQWRAMVGNLDALFVSPGGGAQRGMATMESATVSLSADDAAAIRASVPNVQDISTQQTAFGVGAEANGKSGTTALLGVSPNWPALRGDRIAHGAMFGDVQNEQVERVAVVGFDVANEFFGGAAAVGQHITISGVDFEIVGVLDRNGAGPGGASMDDLVLVPINTTARRVFNRPSLNQIRVQLRTPARSEETAAAVRQLLRDRHQLGEGQLDDFRISTPRAMMAQRASVDSSLRKTILWVGAFVLLLGGMMVANLMYAATASRSAEIGMRRAVGAKRGDILRQFWAETFMIALVGGAIGIVLTLVGVGVGARALHYQLAVSWPVTALAFGVTLVIGLVAGFFPARRAAALPPAAVLRQQE